MYFYKKSSTVQNLTTEIAELYHQLVPSREEGLLIFKLHEKIKNSEIDGNFSIQDIQRTIEETNAFTIGAVPNRERLLKNLLNYFVERPAEQKNRYALTEYARKFILLLEHKINNPYRKFPLRESFKRYTNFSALDIRQINQFESWFNQGFQANTRQNIFEHLEELKSDVHASVQRLNKLLYSQEETIIQTVTEFSVIFTDLGEKADEIRDTLRLGNTLQYEIDQVISFFYEKTEIFKHPSTPEEATEFEALLYAYTRSTEIGREVEVFFEVVDEKLGQLRERIQYASTKLNELQELFRYQSKFKQNLKKLLEFALTTVKRAKGDLILPLWFPRHGIPEERFRLLLMPDLVSNTALRNTVISTPEDDVYYRQELLRVEAELSRQQRTAMLVDQYKADLTECGELDFTAEFYHILESEHDEEIAIQVGYELIQFAHDSRAFQITISPEVFDLYQSQPIITWKTNIKRRD